MDPEIAWGYAGELKFISVAALKETLLCVPLLRLLS